MTLNQLATAAAIVCLFAWPASAADATLSSATCPGTGCQTTTLSGAGSVVVQVNGTFSGTLAFEASIDGTNYVAVSMASLNSQGRASTWSASGAIFSADVTGAVYFRVRFASYTSGSAVISTIASGVTIASMPTTAVTGTFFQATQPISAASTLTTQMAGWLFSNLTTNTTTVVKSGAGVLHCVTVNILGTTSQVIAYDNTAGSGTKIATITTLIAGQTGCYDAVFSTGLTVVTSGAVAADITVSYR